MEPFEAIGAWWEPNSPEKRFIGRLRVRAGSGLDLCLYARGRSAMSGWHARKNVTLFGELGEEPSRPRTTHVPHLGEAITLGGCSWAGEVGSAGDAPLSVLLRVPIAFVGAHLPDWAGVKFHRLKLSIAGMDEWIGPIGLTVSLASALQHRRRL